MYIVLQVLYIGQYLDITYHQPYSRNNRVKSEGGPMGAFEVLLVWFLLSFTGAAAPGPLSAAVIQYSSQRGKLIGRTCNS